MSTPADLAASEKIKISTYDSASLRRSGNDTGWLFVLNAFIMLANCSLVILIEHSLVEGTVLFLAGSVAAGHSPWMVMTVWSGGTSDGPSSRLCSVGGAVGVDWVFDCSAGVFKVGVLAGACASAVLAAKTQINSRNVIIRSLSQFKWSWAGNNPSIMVFHPNGYWCRATKT